MLKNSAVAIIALLAMSACQSVGDDWLSSGFQGANATVAYWLNSAEQHRLQPEQLKQLPGAAIYAKLGENATATMVLSELDETPSYTVKRWVTQSEALTTRYGRIIRTQGLGQNLIYTAKQTTDPLGCWIQNVAEATNTCPTMWRSYQDIETSNARVSRVHSRHELNWRGEERVQTPLRGDIRTRLLEEQVSVLSPFQSDEMTNVSLSTWNNFYWISLNDGVVVRSEQQLTPNTDNRILISEARY
ncbi:YjbF family lipoprotein [Idiomarina sp.]|uniref:YjbF family lipoprotein n=1 Tax=Idiomarina sp. TaxID=1874361 RepID=UPI002EAFD82F|nr:YjbF family lipoprotein [Pseudomonadota bacterium]